MPDERQRQRRTPPLVPDPRMSGSSADGFSLIEVGIMVVILAFSLIPLIGLLGSSSAGATQDVDVMMAVHEASAELERLRSLPWPALMARPEGSLGSQVLHDQTDERHYDLVWARKEVEPGSLLEVVVEVRWKRAGRPVPPMRLATLVANRHGP